MKLLIIGAGKLGKNFAAALRESAHLWKQPLGVSLRPDRKGLPRKVDADVVLLAVRDARIAPLAAELAATRWSAKLKAAIHTSGALPPEALSALRAHGVPVAQLHPMLSFASERQHLKLGGPGQLRFRGGQALVAGDERAVRTARDISRRVGLTPRHWEGVDPALYHAAAALVANGAAALASAGAEVLVAAGVPAEQAPSVLGPLLASVAFNVSKLGLPEALTGPVRRGGVAVIASHLVRLDERVPRAAELYRAVALAQLPMAKRLRDASIKDLGQIEALLRSRSAPKTRGRKSR